MSQSKPLPPVRRVAYGEHLPAALKDEKDRSRAAQLAAAAGLLPPLHAMQVALDQLVRKAEDRRNGEPDPYGKPLKYHVEQTLIHVEYQRDVLAAAHRAADAMIADLEGQMATLERAMSTANDPPPVGTPDPNNQDPPQLTKSGEPHPLQEGGYDANSDPQLPSNISDVEALVEGKGTRKQTEAENAAAPTVDEAEDRDKGQADRAQAPKDARDDDRGGLFGKAPKGKGK